MDTVCNVATATKLYQTPAPEEDVYPEHWLGGRSCVAPSMVPEVRLQDVELAIVCAEEHRLFGGVDPALQEPFAFADV